MVKFCVYRGLVGTYSYIRKGIVFSVEFLCKNDIQFDCYPLRLELLLKHKICVKFCDNFIAKYIIDVE